MSKQLNIFEPIEEQTRAPAGNKNLVEYGIQNENSDYRAHVIYVTQHVYVFPTAAGVKAIHHQTGNNLKDVHINGINTAKGYVVPVSHIDGLAEILIPIETYKKHYAPPQASTPIKGAKATELVVELLLKNLIPLPINVEIVDEKSLQVSGADIIVHSKLKIQVKCDYRGGNKKHNPKATGNLFLQIAECNPYKYF